MSNYKNGYGNSAGYGNNASYGNKASYGNDAGYDNNAGYGEYNNVPVCFRCQEPGHTSRNCKKKLDTKQSAKLAGQKRDRQQAAQSDPVAELSPEERDAKRRRIEELTHPGAPGMQMSVFQNGYCTICNVMVFPKPSEMEMHLAGKTHFKALTGECPRKARKLAKREAEANGQAAAQGAVQHMQVMPYIMSPQEMSKAPEPLYKASKGHSGMTRGDCPIQKGQAGYLKFTGNSELPEDKSSVHVVVFKNVTGASARKLAAHCGPSIQQIDFRYSLTGMDVVAIAEKCRFLEVLDVRGVSDFDLACAQRLYALLPRLKYLDARETKYGNEMSVLAPGKQLTPPNVVLEL